MTAHQSDRLDDLTALILAGGLGIRLREIVPDAPKGLAMVGGRPFLDYLLKSLSAAGVKRVVLCLGHFGTEIQRWAGSGSRWGLEVRSTIEVEPLGTAGAVKLAEALIEANTFLVMNGDSYFRLDLAAFGAFHFAHGAIASIALASVPDVSRYGCVVLGESDSVLQFVEKDVSRKKPGLISAGMYCFERDVLDLIPAGRAVSMEREVLPMLAQRGLRGFVSDGYFIDIGVPEDYLRAQRELPQQV